MVHNTHDRVLQVRAECARVVAPPPDITVSQWAETHRIVSRGKSPVPGPWSNETAPFLTEIMNCYNDPAIFEVTIMKASRIGATEVINNIIGYVIHHDQKGILYVQQSLDEARKYSKQILSPMLQDTACLKARISEFKARDKDNTTLSKSFTGGSLLMVGASSPKGFRMVACPVVFVDDVDGFPVDVAGEGDPVDLAVTRADNFFDRFIIRVSSPTIEGFSRVEESFDASDQRYFYVPCQNCGEEFILMWDQVRWEPGRPETAGYVCEWCEFKHFHHLHKMDMLRGGYWQAEKACTGHAGFQISRLYSPFIDWAEMAHKWTEVCHIPSRRKVFINTQLGKSYEEDAERLDPDEIEDRCEPFPAEVPQGGALLTCGVDIQKTRIELEVVAWGLGLESWSVEYRVIWGHYKKPEVWEQLKKFLLEKEFEHESGMKLKISATCIDANHFSIEVYKFCKPLHRRRVYAIKSVAGFGRPFTGPWTQNNTQRCQLYTLGVDVGKESLFDALETEDPGPGFCHFPDGREKEFFNQLTAEKAVMYTKNGQHFKRFVATRKRNEALDCRNYAQAARELMKIKKFDRFINSILTPEKPESEEPEDDHAALVAPPTKSSFVKKGTRRNKSGFVKGY